MTETESIRIHNAAACKVEMLLLSLNVTLFLTAFLYVFHFDPYHSQHMCCTSKFSLGLS